MDLRRTPLYDEHQAAGARLVPFAGWAMPVQYSGVKEEHLAVRAGCGIFDVSHMGEIEVEGADALEFLQRLLSNDLAAVEIGGAQYSCLCAENGGVLDDLFAYRLYEQQWLVVTNAANHESDLARFREIGAGFDVKIEDTTPTLGMIAVQGPDARAIAASLLADGYELPARFRVSPCEIAGVKALVCGTGYTGEDGVEILPWAADAPSVWRALLQGGATPAGLGARDTLRLEVCFHLHGNDMGPDRNPVEAGLGWCCKEATGFVGSEAIATARAAGTAEKLAAFTIDGSGIPRAGNPLLHDGERVGAVTSGTFSPSLGIGIGMGYVRADLAVPGTEIEVDVRGRVRAARVQSKPLYQSSPPA